MMKKLTILFTVCLFCLLTTTAATVLGTPATSDATPWSAQTGKMYGIGSVSKVFTAAAVMKLVDDGKIDLDEPLTTYMSDFIMADERHAQITPRMLLNHSSGLMGMTDNNAFLNGDNDTYNHDHFLELLKTQTLKHDPGDRSIYSNDSLTLAELLVERVSELSFTDFIEQNFSAPLGIENIKTPQSEFDRNLLADTYLGNSEMKPQSLNVIGSGGIYATMEDLCRYATIFMDSADGSILSKQSVNEMAKVQHQMELTEPGSDTVFRYGLGWDCVEQYPFSQYGIKALSKGGATQAYYTNLTVLPEYNIAAAVASSGAGGLEALIAQEIILAVLEEEGLIPSDSTLLLPEANLNRAKVPESLIAYAGVYEAGSMGLNTIEFTEDSLIWTPIGTRNERPMEFIYNTDGEFVSCDDLLGMNASLSGTRGMTALTFAEDGKYILSRSYEDVPGLGRTAENMPIAERVEANPVSDGAQNAWTERNGKEYLLVSEKYTSSRYIIMSAIAKTLTDKRVPGYVMHGIYDGSGNAFPAVKIADENTAFGYQSTPTMTGRDIVNLYVATQNGVEYLRVNNYRYIDAAAAKSFSALDGTVIIGSETVWVNVDDGMGGKIIAITSPANGSWFVYDDKMSCIATSLEKNPRDTVILPENGRLAFAGEPGAEFMVR